MSPPGKKSGSTTKLSVEKTSSPRMAPSVRALSAGFESAGTMQFSMRRAVFFPPLP